MPGRRGPLPQFEQFFAIRRFQPALAFTPDSKALLSGSGDKTEALVRFRDAGEKRLLLSWAPLEKL